MDSKIIILCISVFLFLSLFGCTGQPGGEAGGLLGGANRGTSQTAEPKTIAEKSDLPPPPPPSNNELGSGAQSLPSTPPSQAEIPAPTYPDEEIETSEDDQSNAPTDDTIRLTDTKCYGGEAPNCLYTVSIVSNGSTLSQIKIINSRDRWNSGETSNGLLYPVNETVSLTGHAANTAKFGQSLPEDTPGKDFYEFSFDDFDSAATTNYELGEIDGLPEEAKGGIKFAYNGTTHLIPFALKLADLPYPGSIFQFDGKTIWYDVNYGKSQTLVDDVNINVVDNDYVNEKKWEIRWQSQNLVKIKPFNAVLTQGTCDKDAMGFFCNTGETFYVDGVKFRVQKILPVFSNLVFVSTDVVLTFRKNNQTGTLFYNINGPTSSQAYGKLLMNEHQKFSSYGYTNDADLKLEGQNGLKERYAVFPARKNQGTLWLMLSAGANLNKASFNGTDMPIGQTEDGTINQYYYVPKDMDFNSEQPFLNPKAYIVARFNQNQLYINTETNKPLGPFPNPNLSYYSQTAKIQTYMQGYTPVFSDLTLGIHETYLQKIYDDNGSRYEVADEKATIDLLTNTKKHLSLSLALNGATKDWSYLLHSAAGIQEIDNELLTKTELPALLMLEATPEGKTAEEQLRITSDFKMDTSSDVKDLIGAIESGNLSYIIDFSEPLTLQELADSPAIPFFGGEYEIHNFSLKGTKYVEIERTN